LVDRSTGSSKHNSRVDDIVSSRFDDETIKREYVEVFGRGLGDLFNKLKGKSGGSGSYNQIVDPDDAKAKAEAEAKAKAAEAKAKAAEAKAKADQAAKNEAYAQYVTGTTKFAKYATEKLKLFT
jgi:hypothetical protein